MEIIIDRMETVEGETKDGKKWSRLDVYDIDGQRYSTFLNGFTSPKVESWGIGSKVSFGVNKSGNFNNIVFDGQKTKHGGQDNIEYRLKKLEGMIREVLELCKSIKIGGVANTKGLENALEAVELSFPEVEIEKTKPFYSQNGYCIINRNSDDGMYCFTKKFLAENGFEESKTKPGVFARKEYEGLSKLLDDTWYAYKQNQYPEKTEEKCEDIPF